jgi:hypothetical protein
MRVSATFLVLVSAIGTAQSLNIFSSGDQSVVIKDDGLDVPGNSPLKYCSADRGDDVITISSVVLTPNPPQA